MRYLFPILIISFLTACSSEETPEGKGLKHVYRYLDGRTENGLPDGDFYANIEIKNDFLEIRRYHYSEDRDANVTRGDILESKKNRDHYYYLIQNAHGDSQIAVRIYTGTRSDMYADSIVVEYREERESPIDQDLIISGDIRWKGKYRKL